MMQAFISGTFVRMAFRQDNDIINFKPDTAQRSSYECLRMYKGPLQSYDEVYTRIIIF